MKSNRKNHPNGHSNGTAVQIVQVTFTHPKARAVAIAGSFNNWKPEITPMVSLGQGRWVKELTLPPGIYEYLFVADGQWLPDPLARQSVPNPFGGANSVIKVEHPPNRVLARARNGGGGSKPATGAVTNVAHG
jgi:1,4-alpha-glucan branching enzyme